MQQFCRTEMLIGSEAIAILQRSSVAVFGLGGVGSYVAEALARAGVGHLTVVDDDIISESNINRQLYALHSTIGLAKTQVAAERIADINPMCQVDSIQMRFESATANRIDFSSFDYVVDAIDTVTSKLLLVELCDKVNTPIISCMGTGNKMNATIFEVADINETTVCPLCKVMRRELKSREIKSLKVVYSKEQPLTPVALEQTNKRQTPGSMPFVPPIAGFILAGEVIKDLINGSV